MKEVTSFDRNFNIFLSVVCYVSLAVGIYVGTARDYLYILLVYVILGINEQAFFHRLSVHRSWNCPDWLKVIGIHIGTLTLLSPILTWVAIHRAHHQNTDKPGDPHSPLYKSNFSIQFLYTWLPFNYVYAGDLLRKKIYLFYSINYFRVIFISWAAIMLLLGPEKFVTIWLAGTALAILSANCINTFHHRESYWFGQYRNKNTPPDTSKNDMLLGYLHFDGWHNNHHADPKKYYYGTKWWEIDLCGIYIWILATLTGYNSSLKK